MEAWKSSCFRSSSSSTRSDLLRFWLRRIRLCVYVARRQPHFAERGHRIGALPSFVEAFLSQCSFFNQCAFSSFGVVARTITGSVETPVFGHFHAGIPMRALRARGVFRCFGPGWCAHFNSALACASFNPPTSWWTGRKQPPISTPARCPTSVDLCRLYSQAGYLMLEALVVCGPPPP